MDIWSWVADAEQELRDAGHARLADIIDQVPRLVGDSHHEQAEALVSEGVTLARQLDHAWIEIFLRHWRAQSRIFYRNDVSQGVDELVRLLDFAHGERTAQCPQSVCVTQDFCGAHSVIDGPGFGAERLAVSAEALARIDARWPCFKCITEEHAEALLDLGRIPEAEVFCRRQLEAAMATGDKPDDLVIKLACVLERLDRLAEAAELLESIDTSEQQPSIRRRHALARTLVYARQGRRDRALAARLDPDGIEPNEFVRWMRAEQALCAGEPERNNAALGTTLRAFIETLARHGSLYAQGELSLGAASLALARGCPRVAALHLDAIDALLPKLRAPAALAREASTLRARIEPLPRCNQPENVVLELLTRDAEEDLGTLQAACEAYPASERMTLSLCRGLDALGFSALAVERLRQFVRVNPGSTSALDDLLRALVRAKDEAALLAFASEARPEDRSKTQFYLGRMYVNAGRWKDAVTAFERVRELDGPGFRSTDANLALAYRHVGRLEEALALLDELAKSETDTADDWERMIVATLLERHDKVRDSARRLGFKFDGEGPIDDAFAYCEVRIPDEFGRGIDYRAVRINPVVARIIAMQTPPRPCLYRDEILVDPSALNPRPLRAEGENPPEDDYVPVFPIIQRLRAGGFRIYDVDGIWPGEPALDALQAAVEKAGLIMSVRSGESYQLTVRQGEPTVRGVYIFIAVPAQVTAEDTYRVLHEALAAWPEPITYRGLLRELGREDELAAQERIAQGLNL
jgi:tetratricopeptide (TPR) repeat protein